MPIAKSYDTPGWSADKAQNEMQQAITALGNNGFYGVLAANDDLAGGAIAAMKSAGIDPATRPTTGQDATQAGIQRILIGTQYMTVYKAAKPEAGAAAQIAVALVKGDDVPSDLINQQVDNGQKKVPSVILTPVAITKTQRQDRHRGRRPEPPPTSAPASTQAHASRQESRSSTGRKRAASRRPASPFRRARGR